MKTFSLLWSSFFLSISILLIGLVCKLSHLNYALPIIIMAMLLHLLFVALSLYEIWTSTYIKNGEKIFWTLGFFIMSLITSFIYFFIGRKRIVFDKPQRKIS